MSKIALGKSGKKVVAIDLDILLRTRMLVQGNSGSGKTHTLKELAEQLFGKVQVIIIDPEGEFATLREKFGYVLVGKGGETPADCRSAAMLAHRLLELRASAVCDLYEMKASERHRWVRLFLEAAIDSPKSLWHPVVFIIDEIHTVCPEKGAGESEAAEAVIGLATRGRKRGFCLVGATQRIGKFRKDAAAELLNVLVGMTFIDIDRKRAAESLGIPKSEERKFFDEIKVTEPGNFWALGRAVSKERILVRVGPVQTTHAEPGSAKHAAEAPPTPDKVKALLPKLADLPKAAEEKAKTEADLRQEIRSLKAQVAAKPKGAEHLMKANWKVVKPEVKEVVKKVEVPIIKPKEILRLERAMFGAVLAAGKAQDAGATLRGFSDKIADQLKKIEQAQRGAILPPVRESMPVRNSVANVQERTLFRGRIPQMKPPTPGVDDIISPKRGKILAALSEFAVIGRQSVPRKWIAARSGSSHRSSAFANNLSSLRSAGLIEYDGGAMIRLTEDGHKLVGNPNELTADEMKESCIKLLSPKQRLIFEFLYDQYPNTVPRQELAGQAQSSPTSSAYANNLSSLRSAGMIEERRDGLEKLSDWVMVEMAQEA
jgi:hypothetical protein